MSNDKNVGTGTPGRAIKRLWHKEGRGMSLRTFARKMATEGNQSAKDWFECKAGALNASRSDKNQARIDSEKIATKASKKSKGKK